MKYTHISIHTFVINIALASKYSPVENICRLCHCTKIKLYYSKFYLKEVHWQQFIIICVYTHVILGQT